jgi:hypothetical protein
VCVCARACVRVCACVFKPVFRLVVNLSKLNLVDVFK